MPNEIFWIPLEMSETWMNILEQEGNQKFMSADLLIYKNLLYYRRIESQGYARALI